MASLVFRFIFLPQLIVLPRAMQDSALYRNTVGCFSVGDFEKNPFSYLWVSNLASSMAADVIDCTFLCVGEPKCYSFNMAVSPDSNGLYLCELLASDKYRSKTRFHANATFDHYSSKTPCKDNPCLSGDCVPDYELNTYHCECKQGFCRSHCEQENKTCSTIKSCNPKFGSGLYAIDPVGKGGVTPFTVFCDMVNQTGVGVTIVGHDSESRTHVNGYESRGGYERNVSYTGAGLTTVAQLTQLADVSAHCEQFIKYECHNSMLLKNGAMYGWWVSRDGEKMKYWGGSHYSFPYNCACGLNRSCAGKSDGCNCDKNDHVWREDSGLLTNKSSPVTQLRFGDTGGSREIGYHTLGKLKCYGIE